MPAAFARTSLRGSCGRAAVVQFAAIRVAPTTYFRFQFYLPDASEGFLARAWEAPASFRRLSAQAAAAVPPMRLRVVTAGQGAAVEHFAAQMRALDHPLEWLMVLNRLSARQDPVAGTKLKIVH